MEVTGARLGSLGSRAADSGATRDARSRARTRAAVLASEGFFRGLSALGRLHPASRPSQHDVELIENIEYFPGGLKEHRLDVYRPRSGRPRSGRPRSGLLRWRAPLRSRFQRSAIAGPPGPRQTRARLGSSASAGLAPVVMYVHGGGFQALSKETHWIMGLIFARLGFVVCNIGYRLAPRHPYPAAIADTCAAYNWITRNIDLYGGDPRRIIVAGESAGANLITALTLATCFERPEPWAQRAYDTGVIPAAALPFCGLLEVSDPARFARRRQVPGWVDDILHYCHAAYIGRHEGALDLANPLTTLERAGSTGERPERPMPPFFVAVGTRDPLLDDSRRLARALDRLGVACEARYYPGEIHAFHALVWRPRARQAWRDAFGFLDRHVGVPRYRRG